MSVHDLLRLVLQLLALLVLLYLAYRLVVGELRNRRRKFLGDYLDQHREDRSAFYKADRLFMEGQAIGCLHSLLGGIAATVLLLTFIKMCSP